jgi:DnaJ family protein C protein 7
LENLKEQGNLKLKEQKYEEAIESYTEALKIDPFNKKLNAIIYANRALAYMKVQKYEQGRDDCDSSIDLDPNYYKSYLRRGKIKEELDDFEAAIFDYQKV